MIIVGWIVFPWLLYSTKEQPIQFSHKVHTGETVGLSCEECHAVGEDGRFTGIPPLEKCAGCHSAQLGTTADEKKLVEDYVVPNREIPWLVYARQPENVYFSHAQHVKIAKIECERCHGTHGSSDRLRPYQENRISGYSRDISGALTVRVSSDSQEEMKMDDCAKCHSERGVYDSCLKCHK